MKFETTEQFATEMDRKDPLRSFRDRFHFPTGHGKKELTYFSGHSLGLAPKSAAEFIQTELMDWAKFGVLGHEEATNPWIPYHEFLSAGLAELLGAKPSEVIVMNSLTVNLHLMMVSFYRPTPRRHKIAIEAGAFPSDRYAVVSQLKFHGFDPTNALIEIDAEKDDLVKTLEQKADQIALLMLGGVNYYSGRLHPMKEIAEKARSLGVVVGFDLAHAAGNVPLEMHKWGADFAIGCSYKYLNAGPGGPGICFVHERHHNNVNLPRFAGWWGHDKKRRFKMEPEFHPIPSAEAWQLSNPSIFALAAARASFAIFMEAGLPTLFEKSRMLNAYLEYLISQAGVSDLKVITPKNRGAMLSLFAERRGAEIYNQLHKSGIVCDWREPNVIRLTPIPLYNSFLDVFRFYKVLKELPFALPPK